MSVVAMKQALEALEYMHTEKCNYMIRNKLGDPLREDATRLAIPAITALRAAIEEAEKVEPKGMFRVGDRVTKIKGSNWTGRVVGTYSTSLTPEGYAVESETENGSVQIYPAAALRAAPKEGK